MGRYKYNVQCQQVRTSAIWKVLEIKHAITYKPYDDSSIDDKEHVWDQGTIMSNPPLSVFILEL